MWAVCGYKTRYAIAIIRKCVWNIHMYTICTASNEKTDMFWAIDITPPIFGKGVAQNLVWCTDFLLSASFSAFDCHCKWQKCICDSSGTNSGYLRITDWMEVTERGDYLSRNSIDVNTSVNCLSESMYDWRWRFEYVYKCVLFLCHADLRFNKIFLYELLCLLWTNLFFIQYTVHIINRVFL